MKIAGTLCVLLLGAGCAMSATARVVIAGDSVESAKRAEADKYAIYEYTKATEYLHKAREEYGYADYEAAGKFADEAQVWGDKAREKTREHPTTPINQQPSAPAPVAPSDNPVITPIPSGGP
jgi:hypothetical protein